MYVRHLQHRLALPTVSSDILCLLDSLIAGSVVCTDLSVADCVHGSLDV